MVTIFLRTVIIYLILIFSMRLMGKRQIGELEVSELVTTLLISEIGALPISDRDVPLIPAVMPIFFLASAEVIISFWKNKSKTVKRVVEGEPVYIIYKGRLDQRALEENRISVNELLTEMRTQGIADLKEVRYAMLEQNGKLSFLKETESPNISKPLVIDAEPNEVNLRAEGLSREWLDERLKEKEISLSDVFLLTVNEDGAINIIKKEREK